MVYVHVMGALVGLLATFFAAMLLSKPFNHWVADLCGAPEGWSMSAYLWQLDQRRHPLGRGVRKFVDSFFSHVRGQESHCWTAWLHYQPKPAT